MNWFNRKDSPGTQSDRDQGATAAQPTPLHQSFNIALPIAVVCLFLWWFCSVPTYMPAPLPPGWTPGCPEWKVTWHEEAVPQTSRVTWHLVRDPGGSRTDVIISEFGNHGSRLYRYDPETGERLAASDPLPPLRTTAMSEGSILFRDFIANGTTDPRVYWLDRETLAVQRQIILQVTQMMGAVVPRIMVHMLQEQPDLHLTGIIGTKTGKLDWQYYWARFDPAGELLAHEAMPFQDGQVFAWPTHDPKIALAYPARLPATATVIDLATGSVIEPPDELTREALILKQWELPSPPDRRGWCAAQHQTDYTPYHARMVEQASHPYVFGRYDGAHSNHPAELLSRLLAEVRRATWQAIWSDEYLDERADQSYRLEQLVLRGSIADPAPRVLAGELLESARTQPLVEPGSSGHIHRGQRVLPLLDAGIDVHQLPGRTLLLSQTLTQFPEGITDAPAIWRVGLLPPEATTVQWLGWMALPTSPTTLERPRVDVRGDRLVIYVPGLFYQPPQGGPSVEIPFRWAIVPLPAELSVLPEGGVE